MSILLVGFLQFANYIIVSWRDTATRRKFFEDYAASSGFDLLVPEQWYMQSIDKIMSFKVIHFLLPFHLSSGSSLF